MIRFDWVSSIGFLLSLHFTPCTTTEIEVELWCGVEILMHHDCDGIDFAKQDSKTNIMPFLRTRVGGLEALNILMMLYANSALTPPMF